MIAAWHTLRKTIASARDTKRRHAAGYLQQTIAFVRFWRRIGAGRTDFYHNYLWDHTRPLADRLAVLCWNDRSRLDRIFNPEPYKSQVNSKLWLRRELAAAGFPTPSTLAVFHVGGEAPPSFDDHGEQALDEEFRRASAPGLVCKPAAGIGGDGNVVLVPGPGGALVDLHGTPWSIPKLLDHAVHACPGTWLVEKRILPHASLRPLMGATLGTVRILSMRFDSGEIVLDWAVLKIPRDGNCGVDNMAFGNLVAPIALDSGVVGTATTVEPGDWYDVHPVNGQAITGRHLPHWESVKSCVTRAAASLPNVAILGWDVALTDDGVILVEANAHWGHELLQIPHRSGLVQGPFRRLLESRNVMSVVRAHGRTSR